MAKTVIKVEDLSKLYRLGEIGTGTLSHDLNRWMARIRGKEDPFATLGSVNDRTKKDDSEYVWALKDINFEVKEGEVLGIIGKNGAGKSTLLKLLSRVTAPSSGIIKAKGRIASLLEVGTGFHPELTGRENIYLNGAILGMRRHEITRKFDEIIDFAGVAKYVDTPVKRYSSGMYVRLAFAVAAHLEPEILIVDEVLAVGDAEFQKKCLGKMGDVAHNEGRTILFVSHNMAAVKELCNKGLLLKNGMVHFDGTAEEAINQYHSSQSIAKDHLIFEDITKAPGNDNIRLMEFLLQPLIENPAQTINVDSGFSFMIKFLNQCEGMNQDCTVELRKLDETVVFHQACVFANDNDSKRELVTIRGEVPPHILNAGLYKFRLIFGQNRYYSLCTLEDILSFEIENTTTFMEGIQTVPPGILRVDLKWNIVNN